MLLSTLVVSALALPLAAALAAPKANAIDLAKLPRLATTSNPPEAVLVTQTGADAEGLKHILSRITLPAGFWH